MRSPRLVPKTALAAVLAASAIALAAADPSKDDGGLALFHKMQAALGGADKIAAIQDFEQQQRAVAINGNTGERMGEVIKRTRFVRPSSVRVDQVGPGSTYVLYFDGKSGWEVLPGATAAIPLEGGELEFAQGYVRGYRLNVWLADRNPIWKVSSPSDRVVRISDGDVSHQLDFVLDAAFLPAKTASITLSDPAHPVPSEEVVSEWETIAGVRLPRKSRFYRAGHLVAEGTAEQTKINQGLKLEDLSAKPADFKPVLMPAAKR
jgi:hypothetical protein